MSALLAQAAVADVLARLDHVRQTARGWAARCPAHRDTSPSLSVLRGHDGRARVRCWAGCTREEILSALAIEDTTTSATTTIRPRSTLELALELARRQAWHREETRLVYAISDAIRRRRRAVDVARAIAGRAGDRPETWRLLATAADVERQAGAIEAELDEAMR